MIRISPLRQRFIDDMELAGLVHGTQETYIRAVLNCVLALRHQRNDIAV